MTVGARTPVVTLLTDFGLRDPFVGVMKGVILARCDCHLVDLSHAIPPQQVALAAFWLERCYSFFPIGTVHLAVVDPGVGSSRRRVVVNSRGHWFVGPDNGLLGWLSDDPNQRAWSLEFPAAARSSTFDGRDYFAPAAAALAAGDLSVLGASIPSLEQLPESVRLLPTTARPGASGRVVVVDHFGNLITNLALEGTVPSAVEAAGCWIPWGASYSAVTPGNLVALENAWGLLEIACRDGSAAAALDLGPGAAVHPTFA